MSNRQIATSCGIGRPTVAEYLRRAQEAGVSWPLPADLDDTRLERMLFPPPPDMPAQLRGIPDWLAIHKELRHKHVTLFLLWQEYREANPDGYQYSWFCEHYRAWQGKLDMVMRQDHRAGEKLFVDYAGQTVPVIDRVMSKVARRISEIPRHKLLGRKQVILLGSGAYNPIHKMHLRMLYIARRYLEERTEFEVLGGFVSPSHATDVRSRYRQREWFGAWGDVWRGLLCHRFGVLFDVAKSRYLNRRIK